MASEKDQKCKQALAVCLSRRQCVRESRSTGDVALDKLSMALDDVLEGHKLEVESAE